jgi:hypothetical protein
MLGGYILKFAISFCSLLLCSVPQDCLLNKTCLEPLMRLANTDKSGAPCISGGKKLFTLISVEAGQMIMIRFRQARYGCYTKKQMNRCHCSKIGSIFWFKQIVCFK